MDQRACYGYMLNWTYGYAGAKSVSKVQGKYKVAPLPGVRGRRQGGDPGGRNSVITVYSKNVGGALPARRLPRPAPVAHAQPTAASSSQPRR